MITFNVLLFVLLRSRTNAFLDYRVILVLAIISGLGHPRHALAESRSSETCPAIAKFRPSETCPHMTMTVTSSCSVFQAKQLIAWCMSHIVRDGAAALHLLLC